MLSLMRRTSGYISIETIIIAGILLALGLVVLMNLMNIGKNIASSSIESINDAQDAIEILKTN